MRKWVQIVGTMVLAFTIGTTTVLSQTLDSKRRPTNMFNRLDACNSDSLLNGAMIIDLLIGAKIDLPHDFATGRTAISDDEFIDYCYLETSYFETFEHNGTPQDWEIAGPELQKIIAHYHSKHVSRNVAFLGKPAILYDAGRTQIFLSIYRGRSARQINVRYGISSKPFSIKPLTPKFSCAIPGYVHLTVEEQTSHQTYGRADLDSNIVAYELCQRSPQACSTDLYFYIDRSERYIEEMYRHHGKEFVDVYMRNPQFNTPYNYFSAGSPGLFFIRDLQPLGMHFLVDTSEQTITPYAGGKPVSSHPCKFK